MAPNLPGRTEKKTEKQVEKNRSRETDRQEVRKRKYRDTGNVLDPD